MLLFLVVQILLVASLVSGQFFPVAQPPLNNFKNLDYYWRDYNGTIPRDAIPSPDLLDNFYFGQALNMPYGIAVVPIYNGTKEVTVFYETRNHNESQGIKILCSPHPENFYWEAANSENFAVDMLKTYPVIGGVEDEESVLHIARAKPKEHPSLVGKVRQHLFMMQHYPGMYDMETKMSAYDAQDDTIRSFSDFQVLVYDDYHILSRGLSNIKIE